VNTVADRITAELGALVGQLLGDCWRAADMQVFGFGPRHRIFNRMGEIEVCGLRLHVQCRWRLVDAGKIAFGRDDLNYPADESVSAEDFDWDKQDSALDVAQRQWFAWHRAAPPRVEAVHGDAYGGFRVCLEGGAALEAFPCDSRRGEYSEHWRLIGHRADGSHFVVTGDGVEGEGGG
jgi:hypothetical protein